MTVNVPEIGGISAVGYVSGNGPVVIERSGNATILPTDFGSYNHCTAALTLSLTAAATLTNGFEFWVHADNGIVTVDPNSTEQINGSSTSFSVADGEVAYIVCDGTQFYATVVSGGVASDTSLFNGQNAAYYLSRTNHTGTQLASTISDFSEAVDDRVSSLLVQGANITLTYDDTLNTLTIASTGGLEGFTGVSNTGLGDNAGDSITSGLRNTVLGVNAGTALTIADDNTALGFGALATNSSALSNTAVGSFTLNLNSTGAQNTAVGSAAMQNNSTGLWCTAVGYTALNANTDGQVNTAVGNGAMVLNTGGDFNTAVGGDALASNLTGNSNVAIGYQALATSTASNNTAVGRNAGNAISTGTNNTLVGYQAGNTFTTAQRNTAVGTFALASVCLSDNTAVGYQALINSTGFNNTAIGSIAGGSLTGGDYNVAIGSDALAACTVNDGNVAIGHQSLFLATGASNIGIGYQAGNTITSGTTNTILGYNADVDSATATNRTAIGANSVCKTDNSVKLGDSAVTRIDLDGTVGKTISIERHPTANTAGNNFSLTSSGATIGATDKRGGVISLITGTGTGNARPSPIQVVIPDGDLTSGTTDHITYVKLLVGDAMSLTNNTVTTIGSLTNNPNRACSAILDYSVEVKDGSNDVQMETGQVVVQCLNKGGVFSGNVATKLGNQQAVTAGTLTVTFTITGADPALIQVNANSSLTPSSGFPRIHWNLRNMGHFGLTRI